MRIAAGPPPQLSWDSCPGFWYQVQSKAILADPNWANLGAPIAAVGATCTFQDGTAGGVTQRFYRVVLVP